MHRDAEQGLAPAQLPAGTECHERNEAGEDFRRHKRHLYFGHAPADGPYQPQIPRSNMLQVAQINKALNVLITTLLHHPNTPSNHTCVRPGAADEEANRRS